MGKAKSELFLLRWQSMDCRMKQLPRLKHRVLYQYEFSSLTYVTSRLRMLALHLIYQFSHESKASLKMFASIKI
jgi:hypothetical protein